MSIADPQIAALGHPLPNVSATDGATSHPSPAMTELPPFLMDLADELAAMPGAVAVVLGGSRAFDSRVAGSDWDLGLYYRGAVGLDALAARGTVYPPGAWGRLMNGGAWLRCGSERVDVLLRDLDVVEHWTGRAEQGDFEVDNLLGYVAGAPTYLLSAELASCRTLRGSTPTVQFPPRLALEAPPRWRFSRSFSLAYARVHAQRGNAIGAVGQAARGIIEEAHAILCERRQWVCNEKRMIDAAGLGAVQALYENRPTDAAGLVDWVDRVAEQVGAPVGGAPWDAAVR